MALFVGAGDDLAALRSLQPKKTPKTTLWVSAGSQVESLCCNPHSWLWLGRSGSSRSLGGSPTEADSVRPPRVVDDFGEHKQPEREFPCCLLTTCRESTVPQKKTLRILLKRGQNPMPPFRKMSASPWIQWGTLALAASLCPTCPGRNER